MRFSIIFRKKFLKRINKPVSLKKNLLLATLLFIAQFTYAQCWNLVWEDEFTGTSLNTNNWSYQIGDGGWGNNELQFYRNGTNNLTVGGGTLKIIAREESHMGADYTSARIRTIDKSDWTHGKMEARIKLPIGQGIWPACWMLPTDNVYGEWPHSGEIDIMEYLGHQPNIAHGTVHYSIGGSHNFVGDSYTLPSGGYNDAFHTFSVEWESGAIRWYIDNILYHSVTEASLGISPWVFDEDFHFILNMAVGGNWPGPPDATTTFPQTMEVDYVRVYQQLSEIEITGNAYIQPADVSEEYSVPLISGATYNWTVPSGSSISSGQGTNTIDVVWGTNSGDVICQITTTCGTEEITHFVEVTTNLFENPSFEDNFINWNAPTNGGAANFSITTTSPQEGLNAAKVEVTATGANPWDIQLQQGGLTLEAGVPYDLSFWAKSETAGLTFPVAFVKNQSPWNLYASQNFTTSLGWTQYTFSFTPTVTDNVLFNIDLGSNLGVFYFDNFSFRVTSALPVELGSFTARPSGAKEVLLEWFTYSEINNNYFDIMSSLDGRDFKVIGSVSGAGNSTDLERYYFIDKEPKNGINYYQLKQVDHDGKMTQSEVLAVELSSIEKMEVYPNPVKDELVIKNFNGGMVRIINVTGKILFSDNLNASEKITLDVSTLEPGIYFLNTYQGVLRFVK